MESEVRSDAMMNSSGIWDSFGRRGLFGTASAAIMMSFAFQLPFGSTHAQGTLTKTVPLLDVQLAGKSKKDGNVHYDLKNVSKLKGDTNAIGFKSKDKRPVMDAKYFIRIESPSSEPDKCANFVVNGFPPRVAVNLKQGGRYKVTLYLRKIDVKDNDTFSSFVFVLPDRNNEEARVPSGFKVDRDSDDWIKVQYVVTAASSHLARIGFYFHEGIWEVCDLRFGLADAADEAGIVEAKKESEKGDKEGKPAKMGPEEVKP
jgi:hypothetical protein